MIKGEIQVLLHQVDILIGLPAQVCSYFDVPCGKVDLPMKARLGSGVLFVAGMVTFITPASFGTDPLERSTDVELLFVIVALFPSAGYMVFFGMLMLRCFVKHRKICNLRQQTPSHRSDDSISQGEQSEQ